jgi:hypothetical protein
MSTEVSAFIASVPPFVGELASNPDVNANFWALLLLRACVGVSKSVALFRLIMVEAN